MQAATIRRPKIHNYYDYRQFLADMYSYLKVHKRGFSYRSFSKDAGFSSQSVLRQALSGQRNIAEDSIDRFSQALGLSPREATHFRTLVQFVQAKTETSRNEKLTKLYSSRTTSPAKRVASAQFEVYQTWYVAAIRELICTSNFREDYEWIARRLKPAITAAQARRAIKILLECKLIQRDSDGALSVSDTTIEAPEQTRSLIMRNFNREMIDRAREAIELFEPDTREISGITLSCSKEMAPEIIERIRSFKKELLARLEAEKKPSEDVFQFNVQFFPLINIEPSSRGI